MTIVRNLRIFDSVSGAVSETESAARALPDAASCGSVQWVRGDFAVGPMGAIGAMSAKGANDWCNCTSCTDLRQTVCTDQREPARTDQGQTTWTDTALIL